MIDAIGLNKEDWIIRITPSVLFLFFCFAEMYKENEFGLAWFSGTELEIERKRRI